MLELAFWTLCCFSAVAVRLSCLLGKISFYGILVMQAGSKIGNIKESLSYCSCFMEVLACQSLAVRSDLYLKKDQVFVSNWRLFVCCQAILAPNLLTAAYTVRDNEVTKSMFKALS